MDQFRARTKDAPFWLLSEKLSPGTTALSSIAADTTLSRLLIALLWVDQNYGRPERPDRLVGAETLAESGCLWKLESLPEVRYDDAAEAADTAARADSS